MSRTALRTFLADVARFGRQSFTLQEAERTLKVSHSATRQALGRLKRRSELAEPIRGLFFLVPPPYRRLGCLPAESLIDELMRHLARPYYVGLLSAAAHYGAAHHQPQVFQVVVTTPLRRIRCGKVQIEFIAKLDATEVPYRVVQTERGELRYSTPETTVFDLLAYTTHSGGLDNIATVLAELTGVLRKSKLRALAEDVPLRHVQRLGYLLEVVDASHLAQPLKQFVNRADPKLVPLDPRQPMAGAARNEDWRISINTTFEPEL